MEQQYRGHTGPVTAVAVSPNGQILASADRDGILRFWNPTNGQQVGLIGGHDKPLASLSFHPGRQQLLSCSPDGSVKVWQVPLPPQQLAHGGTINAAMLTPDGTRLLT